MKLAFSIAVRFLKSGKIQTWFIILGIAIGVSVQVFIGSLISGLQKSLVDKTIGNSSQITITVPSGEYMDDYSQIISNLSSNVEGIEVYTPTITARGTLLEGTDTSPVVMRGFTFETANQIYNFEEKITEGRMPNSINEIVLGIGFKESLNIELNDQLTFDVPTIGTTNVIVVGFFDFKVQAINTAWAITTLNTVQTALGVGDVVDSIESQIEDGLIFDAVEIAALVQTQFVNNGEGSPEVSNWIDNNEELLSGLQGQSISSIMIQVFVMISVVLAIASVLAIIVMQKSRQIGILKAMGIQNLDASLIFLFEGLILGLLGAIFGVALGLGLSYSFTTFALKADGTPVVPLFIDPGFIALSAAIAVTAALGASLIPARKSSKLSVIEVIRNA
ncbi:MAG: ABC transporter permease [Tenericutes bacterium HGW-Tenericutes-1]|jgi:lipoprotein-releasing system permease protein|nr:MAG: ABC transporter permease [Tenericutes bacterium HGW-Tenericutes-1]